jgi:hypothetical protein
MALRACIAIDQKLQHRMPKALGKQTSRRSRQRDKAPIGRECSIAGEHVYVRIDVDEILKVPAFCRTHPANRNALDPAKRCSAQRRPERREARCLTGYWQREYSMPSPLMIGWPAELV